MILLFGVFVCCCLFFFLFLYAVIRNSSFNPEKSSLFYFFFIKIPKKFANLFILSPLKAKKDDYDDNHSLFNMFQALVQKAFSISSSTSYIGILIYYLLYHGIAVLFLRHVFPFFPFILENPEFHHMFVFFVLLLPWIIALIFQFVDPGNITQENVDEYLKIYLNSNNRNKFSAEGKNKVQNGKSSTNDNNKVKIANHDQILFHQQQQQIQLSKCSNLHIPAVPRSRFCPFSKKRIAKYDHYCPWLMQPIGEKNIRLYLLFLLSNFLVATYFIVISEMFLIWKLKYTSKIEWSKDSLMKNFMFSCIFLLNNESMVCGISIFFIVFQWIVLSFIIREIYLISVNLTLDEIMVKKEESQSPIVSEYDKGIFYNWLEVLFPSIL